MKKFLLALKSATNVMVAALLAVAVSLQVSCTAEECTCEPYDDSELWNAIEDIYERLDALEDALDEQVKALRGMISGLVTVTEVTTESDGTRRVYLSDETVLIIAPEYDAKGMVTIMTVEGVQVWAVINANGEVEAVRGEDGNMIPVVPNIPDAPAQIPPQVRLNEESGNYEISFDGGLSWAVTGTNGTGSGAGCNCPIIFTDVEVVDDGDEMYPQPLYVRLTLAGGQTITVTIEDVNRIMFSDGMNIYESYYLAPGSVLEDLSLMAPSGGLEDIIVTKPDGWKVSYTLDPYRATFTIMAPSKEAIAVGAAESGELKVLASFAGGATATAGMELSTQPLTLSAGNGQAIIAPYGNFTYAYGIFTPEEYNEETISNYLIEFFTTATWRDELVAPYGQGSGEMTVDLDALSGGVLEGGKEYIVFAAPMMPNYETGQYSIPEIVKINYIHKSVKIETVSTSFNDIQIKVEMAGVSKYYASIAKAASFPDHMIANIAVGLNDEWADFYYNSYTKTSYEGSLADFVTDDYYSKVATLPNNEYVVWIAIIEDGKTYTENDILVYRFASEPLTSGGSINVSVTPTIDYASIKFNLSAPDATLLYSTYYKNTPAPATEEDILADLYKTTPVSKETNNISVTSLKAGDEITLVTLAVDADGKYGTIFTETYTPKAIEYSPLTIAIDETKTEIGETSATIAWSVTGGTAAKYCYFYVDPNSEAYRYWYNRTGTNNPGGTPAGFESFVITNASGYSTYVSNGYIHETTEPIAANLAMVEGVKYSLLVMAQDAEGKWSHVFEYAFEPTVKPIELTFVEKGAEAWNSTKPAKIEYSTDVVEFADTYAWITPSAVSGIEYYALIAHPDLVAEDAGSDAKAIAEYIIKEGEAVVDAATPIRQFYGSVGWNIYVTWKDATNIYESIAITTENTKDERVEATF